MKTNWTAPGKGDTLGHLYDIITAQLLAEAPRAKRLIASGYDLARTNLYITTNGVFEDHDLQRLEHVDIG